ncbi:ALI_HP2_G0021480.mRNA.1.CDS.1 [Saccharomyces cerevisiae]|nr:ALI_HP2_G0021480.mRNA.1.CDS.1 [Saccharomyces cerevisiae]CAI6431519.1 ALI_HP2_G0021480.mRNA.1.CDS.1 [Saccharomyces cerevisiae]
MILFVIRKAMILMGDTPQAKKLTAEGYGNIILSLFDGEPYDSWQIKLLAKKNKTNSEQIEQIPMGKFSRISSPENE